MASLDLRLAIGHRWACPNCKRVVIVQFEEVVEGGKDWAVSRIEKHIKTFHQTEFREFLIVYPFENSIKPKPRRELEIKKHHAQLNNRTN